MGTIESKECVEFVAKEAIILQGVKNAYVGLALFMKTESDMACGALAPFS